MNDTAVAKAARSPRMHPLLITGWATTIGAFVYLLVIGCSFAMGLAFTSPTLIVVSVVAIVVGVVGVAVASVDARRGGREPQPFPQSLKTIVTFVCAGAAAGGIVLGAGSVYLLNTAATSHAASIPESKMTVAQAAQAYLDAAVRHDCWYTYAHTDTDRTFSWCSDPVMMDFDSVEPAEEDPNAGRAVWIVGFEMTTTRSSDETIPAGSGSWYLYFTRENGIWKVYDQGPV